MTVKQLIEKLQKFPEDWPVAVKVYDKGDQFYEPDPSKDFYHEGTDCNDTAEGLYDGQQVVSL